MGSCSIARQFLQLRAAEDLGGWHAQVGLDGGQSLLTKQYESLQASVQSYTANPDDQCG